MPQVIDRELIAVVMPNASLQLEWTGAKEPVDKSSNLLQEEVCRRFNSDSDSWLLFLGFCDHSIPLSPSLDFWRNFTGLFAKRLSQTPDLEILRDKLKIPIEEDELRKHLGYAPLMTGSEYLSTDLLKSIWLKLLKTFSQAIKSYQGTVKDFIKTYSPDVHLLGRIFFHLVENKNDDYPFAFLATYSTGLSKQGKSKHLPLKHALQEYENDKDKLLSLLATVHLAAKKSPFIFDLLETGELFHPLAWTSSDAFSFLKEIIIYEESGILCRIPNWWKGGGSRIRLNISVGDSRPSFLGMDTLLNFNIRLFFGDTEISEKEARQLLDESEGLAYIKNRWVAVDREKLRQTLDAYEKAKKVTDKDGLSLKDALRLQLNPEKILNIPAGEIDHGISHGKWLESVIQKLVNPDLITSINPARGFGAKLREYQQKGLNWFFFLHSLQFGACLADDMGLGKTVQLLAFLSTLKSRLKKAGSPNQASLLIIPASLISNWVNEIKRFSPDIKFHVAHPAGNSTNNIQSHDKIGWDGFDLVITTYTLVQKYEWLQTHSWRYIILDEAQAIKNPGTKQTRAIKKLSSRNRIVMTGTPVENRLLDLWSLFDFLNPGLLGSIQEFKQFSKRLNDDRSGYAKLRKLISPYILRRLKTDKSVISDLPDKVEMKTYVSLSKKQVILYQNLVKEIKETIVVSEGIQRKGIILSSLMKFKQICNHPGQYLGTGDYKEIESGKFIRLRELSDIIYEKREKVLVFTQFKEMTEPICEFMESIFKRPGLILHGSVPVSKRKNIINHFQDKAYVPFMVLSLKAGGVGLNLTEANHVIHFDRWWNPAVENQATDRVHRIGQTKNVIVHKFLTKGTVEEKIDMMLEEKSGLSRDVISSTGEAWITEMKNDQLMNLLTLTL